MKTKLILLITFLAISGIAPAQKSTAELTGEFFKLYETSTDKAIDYVFSTNHWIVDEKTAEIIHVKEQLKNLIALIGTYQGYEKINEKQVGESYKLESYMIKYDREPLRFTFVMYKPKDTWQIENFMYDDNVDLEIEEAGKIR